MSNANKYDLSPVTCEMMLAIKKDPEKQKCLDDPGMTRLIPLVDWPKYHPWPPLGGLRHMVFHGESTGFSKVTKKVGRRILIDEKKFFEFVDEQNSKRGESK